MIRSTRALGTSMAAAALLCGAAVAPVAADPPFTVEVVSGPTFTTNPDRLLLVAKIHIPSDGYVDWHRHPGFVSVTVEGAGTLSLMSKNCKVQEYTAGDTFTPPRVTHTARNFSHEPVTAVATFLVRGTMPTVMADAATNAKLDERCDLSD